MIKVDTLKKTKTFILGAGITGLTAGYTSGLPIYEKENVPGGICSSYYIKPGTRRRLLALSHEDEAYHFEIGGGHWIFGADKKVTRFLENFCTLKKYKRKSGVYLSKENLYVPYPLQNNLRYLPEKIKEHALEEILTRSSVKPNTLKDWLQLNFGKTLCNIFFFPFHELYTAGLFEKISPQDCFKTPVDISSVLKGAQTEVEQVGYNVEFVYPKEGLNILVKNIAKKCKINYHKEAVRIDVKNRTIYFKDKTSIKYDKLISTLPLNRMIKMTNIKIKEKPAPYTSVLVLNIGAKKGENCPDYDWLYSPNSKSGFHRVGFYSNVDEDFLPKDKAKNYTSIYVERAYLAGKKPSQYEIKKYSRSVKDELKSWGFIGKIDVIDIVWIDVAYTWSWPNSRWRQEAIEMLKSEDIYQIGRYGHWKFQGIAESIKEGLRFKAIGH